MRPFNPAIGSPGRGVRRPAERVPASLANAGNAKTECAFLRSAPQTAYWPVVVVMGATVVTIVVFEVPLATVSSKKALVA